MNYLCIAKSNQFQDLIDSKLLISGYPENWQEETDINMWAINLSPTMKMKTTPDDLKKFFNKLCAKKKEQLENKPATFYMWYDEMACQIRFNFLSGCNISVPFECSIQKISDPETIFLRFLNEKTNAISFDEFTFIEDDELDNIENEYILDVYIKCLNG